ncbi:MAG: AAA family ATPase [Candidatus Omnitrophica bacterium]|nr:AAA family ATPase [Candidatus Omnitrophota bacterium]
MINNKIKSDLIGPVLVQTQHWWTDNNMVSHFIQNFIHQRINNGENLTLGDSFKNVSYSKIQRACKLIKTFDNKYAEPLLNEIQEMEQSMLDISFLNSIGRIWTIKQDQIIIEHSSIHENIQHIDDNLFNTNPRSVLLIGESGAGKTVIIQSYARQLQNRGWHIFECRSTDLIAGQSYIGQLEQRVQDLLKHLHHKRKIIWVIPNIQEFQFIGQSRYSPISVLDMILPFIEQGKLKVIGEIHTTAFEQLIRENQRVRTSFEIISIPPLDDDSSFKLAEKWLKKSRSLNTKIPKMDNHVLQEASHLTKQFLTDTVNPGNLLSFLKTTQSRLINQNEEGGQVTVDDLFTTLAHLTGLPRNILDDKQGLDLDSLNALFLKRVQGQPEAVECLLDRVAMIKTGLSDPTRPYGVFLFAGPTGTGKTEIAKTLAEFLFGSQERMIRVDMSELKTSDAIDRITGISSFRTSRSSLMTQIRKHPFSVILLDEFEKAHPNIWDLFLQVFDDGILTDKHGHSADFRHAIIIMTSNIGAQIELDHIGFEQSGVNFSISKVEKSIRQTFRPEFINRIDRLIIFRPLNRATMRTILYKELDHILERRGLRNRQWCVEWEDSAIDFLLKKGFTPDLGARALKRSIERYLLTPLALTIVNHQLPEGDQFLFVRSDNHKIQVEFIDPDITDEPTPAQDTGQKHHDQLCVRHILAQPTGQPTEFDLLRSEYKRLAALINTKEWDTEKNQSMLQLASSEFWSSPQRTTVLGQIEYMDRIETALETAGSLLKRLASGSSNDKTHYRQDIIKRLALQLYLLNAGYLGYQNKTNKDVFVLIEAHPAPNQKRENAVMFAQEISLMYQNWAKNRRMHLFILKELSEPHAGKYQAYLSIAGFGVLSFLEHEHGIHIFEDPKTPKTFQKYNTAVKIAVQPDNPYKNEKELRSQAEALLKHNKKNLKKIVRRYRRQPDPLVRDNVKGWRTGRLDLILQGHFDLID